MKVTIVEYENAEDAVWDGEALCASWDRDTGEFVIQGTTNGQPCSETVAILAQNRKLMVEIEDTGPGQLVWRGYVGTAEFLSFDSDEVECALVMLLDDWFGIESPKPPKPIPTPVSAPPPTPGTEQVTKRIRGRGKRGRSGTWLVTGNLAPETVGMKRLLGGNRG